MRLTMRWVLVLTSLLFGAIVAAGQPERRERPRAPAGRAMSLAHLMANSDLIILGNAPALPVTKAGYDVTEIQLSRFIASVWSYQETRTHMVVDKAGADRVLLVQRLPYTNRNPQVALLPGGRFLLWLKRVELSREGGAKMGPGASACYEVVGEEHGAILVSDPRKLRDYEALVAHAQRLRDRLKREGAADVWIPDHPFAFPGDLLKRSLGTADRSLLLRATERLAWALSQETLGREVLKTLAENDQPIYSSTARQLLELPRLKRFRCLGL